MIQNGNGMGSLEQVQQVLVESWSFSHCESPKKTQMGHTHTHALFVE
jgi:hypothetical protein